LEASAFNDEVAFMSHHDPEELERLAREDVEELTRMLRTDPSWSDFRDYLHGSGYDPRTLLFAAFVEGEEGEDVGVLVTREGRALRFTREPIPEDTHGRMRVVRFIDITGNDVSIRRAGPQVGFAQKLARGGSEGAAPHPASQAGPSAAQGRPNWLRAWVRALRRPKKARNRT
jgi:hypothetical protein